MINKKREKIVKSPLSPIMSSSAVNQQQQQQLHHEIPVSLNKASLRIRLEAYYTLIAPETLSNRSEWFKKYDQIYEKVSGSVLFVSLVWSWLFYFDSINIQEGLTIMSIIIFSVRWYS